ncbi:MAG: matrixin family metalloprotease [Hormoscilla sp.]
MRQLWLVLRVAIASLILAIATHFPPLWAGQQAPLAVHPLPPSLAQWQDKDDSGDYFDRVEQTEVGYLVWSSFPIKIYLDSSGEDIRGQAWREAVWVGVKEWQVYLPLEMVERQEMADITIKRKNPPLQLGPNGELGRVRAALARFKLYNNASGVLSHKFTIWLSPNQTSEYTTATARHEMGHALGIWGHSPNQSDVMYFSQLRHPPRISARDVNTLKRVYQQPTRLGWKIAAMSKNK